MSYDLTIKGDENYSRSTPKSIIESFIAGLSGVKRNGKQGFALGDRRKRWMEIDLEVVNEEGDYIEEEGIARADINCIRLHIPYKFLGDQIEVDYLPTAFAIAEHLGWTLYDDQEDEPVLKAGAEPEETGTPVPSNFDRKKFIGQWIAFPYSFDSTRMDCEIFEDGRFTITMHSPDGKHLVSADGDWDLVGNAFQWTYKTTKGIPRPRRPELNKILRSEENSWIILEKSGDETTFRRPLPSREVSTTSSLDKLKLMLEKLVKHIDGGFAGREIDYISAMAERLKPKKSCQLGFKITFHDMELPFSIRVTVLEDKNAKVVFSAPVELSDKIQEEINGLET